MGRIPSPPPPTEEQRRRARLTLLELWDEYLATAPPELREQAGSVAPFDRRAADALADEVAVLVRRGVIDSRSPAADALLDYRNPPSSPRADRLAELEAELAELRKAVARPLIPESIEPGKYLVADGSGGLRPATPPEVASILAASRRSR